MTGPYGLLIMRVIALPEIIGGVDVGDVNGFSGAISKGDRRHWRHPRIEHVEALANAYAGVHLRDDILNLCR